MQLFLQLPKGQSSRGGELDFSEEEVDFFSLRLEEGYDLTHDDRYNAWLDQFHSTQGKVSAAFICEVCPSTMVCSDV